MIFKIIFLFLYFSKTQGQANYQEHEIQNLEVSFQRAPLAVHGEWKPILKRKERNIESVTLLDRIDSFSSSCSGVERLVLDLLETNRHNQNILIRKLRQRITQSNFDPSFKLSGHQAVVPPITPSPTLQVNSGDQTPFKNVNKNQAQLKNSSEREHINTKTFSGDRFFKPKTKNFNFGVSGQNTQQQQLQQEFRHDQETFPPAQKQKLREQRNFEEQEDAELTKLREANEGEKQRLNQQRQQDTRRKQEEKARIKSIQNRKRKEEAEKLQLQSQQKKALQEQERRLREEEARRMEQELQKLREEQKEIKRREQQLKQQRQLREERERQKRAKQEKERQQRKQKEQQLKQQRQLQELENRAKQEKERQQVILQKQKETSRRKQEEEQLEIQKQKNQEILAQTTSRRKKGNHRTGQTTRANQQVLKQSDAQLRKETFKPQSKLKTDPATLNSQGNTINNTNSNSHNRNSKAINERPLPVTEPPTSSFTIEQFLKRYPEVRRVSSRFRKPLKDTRISVSAKKLTTIRPERTAKPRKAAPQPFIQGQPNIQRKQKPNNFQDVKQKSLEKSQTNSQQKQIPETNNKVSTQSSKLKKNLNSKPKFAKNRSSTKPIATTVIPKKIIAEPVTPDYDEKIELSSDDYSYFYSDDYYEDLVPPHHRFNQLQKVSSTTHRPVTPFKRTQIFSPTPKRPKKTITKPTNTTPKVVVKNNKVSGSSLTKDSGPFGYIDKGSFFTDEDITGFPSSVLITYQGFVWALKVDYDNKKSAVHGGVHTILKDKVKSQKINLKDDYIVRISGRASPYNINRFTLYTASGKKYGPYGDRRNEDSIDFDVSAPKRHALAYFSGTIDFGVPLRSIGFHWRPIQD